MWLRTLAAVVALAATPPAFVPALPGYTFEFPRDHGTHDEYKTEWWYYTGHLTTDGGHRYGFELTFFRVGLVPPECGGGRSRPPCPAEAAGPTQNPPDTRWDLRNLGLAHFAITDVDGKAFRYYEKMNRWSPFTGSAASDHLDVFNEGWRASTMPDGSWHLVAFAKGDRIDLVLRTRKPPAIHGENGVSVKAAGTGYASHYYSMTRLEVSGSVNGARCRGQAWMDHEFGSSALRENQRGWDWFSIQFDNDAELMLYQIRRADGSPDITSSGSLIASDGSVIHLRANQLLVQPLGKWKSPKTKAVYPMGWRVSVPAFNISATLRPLLNDQELVTSGSTHVTYWEGAVDASGSFGGVAVRGEGYVEMTGYDKAFRAP